MTSARTGAGTLPLIVTPAGPEVVRRLVDSGLIVDAGVRRGARAL